jgi:PPM family protein phosphatase
VSAARVRVGSSTDIGSYREVNNDFRLLDDELGLFAVFDTHGWSAGRAGPVSAEVLRQALRARSGADPRALIEWAFRTADEKIRDDPEDHGRTEGASVALVLVRSARAFITGFGATMVYRTSGSGIESLTRPDFFEIERSWNDLTTRAPYRNFAFYRLGHQLPDPLEVISFDPQPGDRLILTTDGISSILPVDIILHACRTFSDPTTCAEVIAESAVRKGSRDNCTCAVLAFGERDFR